ncbi:hypothetical protein Tco_0743466 [Tanacetum coccineum]
MWTPKLQNLPHKLRRFPKAKSLELKVDSEENNLQNTHLSPRLRHPNPKLANQKKKLSPVRPRTKAQAILHLPLLVGEMHKEAQQAVGGLTSLGATNPQLNADPGLSAPNDSIPSQQEEVAKDKDTHASSYDVPEDTSIPHPPSLKLAQIQELKAQV